MDNGLQKRFIMSMQTFTPCDHVNVEAGILAHDAVRYTESYLVPKASGQHAR